jgi:plastocyanin
MHALSIAARSARTAPLALTMTLVIVLAACASSPAASPATSPAASSTGGGGGAGGVGTITISGSAFSPTSITVASGDPINFKNNDGFDHEIVQGENGTAVADPAFEAISLGASDQTHDIRFSPGAYKVTCTIHPSMNMTVTVTE